MKRRAKVSWASVLGIVGLLFMVSAVSAGAQEEPALPALPVVKKKPKSAAAPDLPSLPTPHKKRSANLPKKPKAEAIVVAPPAAEGPTEKVSTLTTSEPVSLLLADLKVRQTVKVVGPGKMSITTTRTVLTPKTARINIMHGNKRETAMSLKDVSTTATVTVPAGEQTYFFAVTGARKPTGDVSITMASAMPAENVADTSAADNAAAAAPATPAPPTTAETTPPAEAAPPPAATTGPTPWVLVGHNDVVHVSSDGDLPYYRLLKDRSVNLKLNGPARLPLTVRRTLNGDAKASNVALGVEIDGKMLWTVSLRVQPSDDHFDKLEPLRPGQAETFDLNIPAGAHTGTIKLFGRDANGAVVAFSRPTNSAGVAEAPPVGSHGSHLSAIAWAAYDREDLWPVLYEVNRSVIGQDPNQIQLGGKLILPTLDEAKLIQEWLNAGKPNPPPEALVRLRKAAGNEQTLANMGDQLVVPAETLSQSMRHYLDDAVHNQVQIYLRAMVESGAVESSNAAIEVYADGSSIELREAQLTIDDDPVPLALPSADQTRRTFAGKVELLPGPHRVVCKIGFRRGPFGPFTYMEKESYLAVGEKGFMAQAGKNYHLVIVAYDQDGATLTAKDRTAVRIDVGEEERRARPKESTAP